MSNEYEPILHGLRKLKAQGEDGFEGFVRDLLEVLCGRTLRLVKSGPQSGKDVMSEGGALSTGIAIEAKKFEDKTALPLDELKSKLRDALDTSPTMDVWGVALSKEMKEPDWSELVRIAAEGGVTAVCLDWRSAEGTLPRLAALCAAARDITERRLPTKVKSALDAAEAHPEFERVKDEIRHELSAPEIGFDLAREAASKWLSETVKTTAAARRRLRSHANILGDNAHSVVRTSITESLTRWFEHGFSAPAVLLGDEGRGKTWAALSWLLHQTESQTGPLVMAVPARKGITKRPALPSVMC